MKKVLKSWRRRRESVCALPWKVSMLMNHRFRNDLAKPVKSFFRFFSLCLHGRTEPEILVREGTKSSVTAPLGPSWHPRSNDARFWCQNTRLPRSGVIHRLVISVTWSGAGGQTPVARRRFETVESEGSQRDRRGLLVGQLGHQLAGDR